MSGLINDIYSQIPYIPRAIILTIIVTPAYLFIRDNDKKQIKNKVIAVCKQPWLFLFLGYTSFLLVSTLFARWPRNPYGNVINSFGLYDDNGWNMECIENTLLFIPYTFLFLKGIKPSKPLKSTLTIIIITTLSIELLQLVFWLGQFQIADIFHNCVGGIIGYIICAIYNMIFR